MKGAIYMAKNTEVDELETLRQKYRALEEERKALGEQVKKLEQERLEQKKAETWDKLENMTDEEREYILGLVPHECASCSRGHSENGWSYSRNRYSCRRCMLEEMFNGEHGGRFDFRLDVVIEENHI